MSYISNYLKATEGTKPAFEFHVWCMLYTLSVFAGKRFWMPFGPFAYYPHLYVCLVGNPACAKSTAMDMAKDIVRASGVTPIAATSITKQAMSQKMSSTIEGAPKKKPYEGQRFFMHEGHKVEYNQFAIFATELIEFLGPQQIASQFLDCLTSLWTEQIWDVETKNKGSDFVYGPYVTLIGCMTPEKLKGYMKQDILGSGFARRCAFMYAAHYNLVPWPTYTEAQASARDFCIDFGRKLQSRSGPMNPSDACKRHYEEWFQENERTLTEKPPKTQSWFASKGEMLWKLSMLICLAEIGLDLTAPLIIEEGHFKMAERFCAMLEKTLDRVFEGTGINPNAGVITQVVRMLEALGKPMNKKHLLATFVDQATGVRELQDVIDHLVNVGRLKEVNVTVNGQMLGTVIGTPEAIDACPPAQLALFLKRITDTAIPTESPTDATAYVPSVVTQASPDTDFEAAKRQAAQAQPAQPAVPDHLNPAKFVISFENGQPKLEPMTEPNPEGLLPD